MFKFFITYFLTLLCTCTCLQAQSSPIEEQPQATNTAQERGRRDSTYARRHSPAASMIMSACLPGLGQAYNNKFWKIPIIYTAMGTTIYFFNLNNKQYQKYNQAYINKMDTSSSTPDNYPDYSPTQLSELKNYHRKYRDLNVILATLFYSINILDAYVDAHLSKFDVSDNLSLRIAPALDFNALRQKPTLGMSLSLRF